jgi:hypothetical protein
MPDRGRGALDRRVAGIDRERIGHALDEYGWAVEKDLLGAAECRALAALYGQDDRFRSRVVMARHGYGSGEYRYFRYPLPGIVETLRTTIYPHLVEVANRWHAALSIDVRFPVLHADFLDRCHAAGQTRPTPLILRYGSGDYNCLHQDLYGEHVFPIQVAVLLSRPGHEFSGGEFMLTEQRPRMQSRPHVVALDQGDAVLFAVQRRPLRGRRGWVRVVMRHGVSRIHSGSRHALGIIFHDAA